MLLCSHATVVLPDPQYATVMPVHIPQHKTHTHTLLYCTEWTCSSTRQTCWFCPLKITPKLNEEWEKEENRQKTSVTHHLYVHISDIPVPITSERLAFSWWHVSQGVMLHEPCKYRKYSDIVSLTTVTSHCLPGPVTYITKENFNTQRAGSLTL